MGVGKSHRDWRYLSSVQHNISLNLTMPGQTWVEPETLLGPLFRIPPTRQVFSVPASQVSSVVRSGLG